MGSRGVNDRVAVRARGDHAASPVAPVTAIGMTGTASLWGMALAVLLVIFNVTYRLGDEHLGEWDEALYAATAFEMVSSGDWIGTTSSGALDYYNSKPPLNVWLIALSIKTFGASLVSLRLVSAAATVTTALVLAAWTWTRFGPPVAAVSTVVLATSFGFIHVHAGRSANPDALLALLLFSTVVVLDIAAAAPARRLWLGPLLAAVFLLKGMAVVLPLLLIAVVEARRRLTGGDRWRPLLGALALFVLPIGAWAVARWRVDRWAFFERMLAQDLIGVTTTVLDGQRGSPLFYVNIVQKHQYDWLAAAALAFALYPVARRAVWQRLAFWRGGDRATILGAWSVITLVVPTLMRTKLPWYINPFYPVFALAVATILDGAWVRAQGSSRRRRHILIVAVVVALGVAEGKLLWYSLTYRALDRSAQALVLQEAARLRGAHVFRRQWSRADTVVLTRIAGGHQRRVGDVDEFIRQSKPGDYLIEELSVERQELRLVAGAGRFMLFERR